MEQDHQDTDAFLAIRYPNIKEPRKFLEQLNEDLGILWPISRGNVEAVVRWSGNLAVWFDWRLRRLTNKPRT